MALAVVADLLVVVLLQRVDHVGDLVGTGHLLGQLLRHPRDVRLQRAQRELQLSRVLDGLEQLERRVRVRGRRHVVGHVRRKPGDGLAALMQGALDEDRSRAGHRYHAVEGVHVAHQLAAVAVCRDDQRAGVRGAHRRRVEADRLRDAEALRQVAHGLAERLPPQVGLGAGQEEEGAPCFVTKHAQVQLQVIDVRDLVLRDGHRGAARAVVNELIVAKRGERAGVQRRLEVLGGSLDGVAGVGVTLHCHHERRAVRGFLADGGRRVFQFIHARRIRHVLPPK